MYIFDQKLAITEYKKNEEYLKINSSTFIVHKRFLEWLDSCMIKIDVFPNFHFGL